MSTTAVATGKPSSSEIYDRQIRLWGADAQSKISSAKVLYIHMTGVSCEILKNLVLAGVSPTIFDPRPFPDAMIHTPTSFFPQPFSTNATTVAKAIQPYVTELNPLIKESSTEGTHFDSIEALCANEEFINSFSVVIASQLSIQYCIQLATLTAKNNACFYLVDTFGMNGCAVVDLGPNCVYRNEIGQDKKLSDPIIMRDYIPLKDLFERKLKDATARWDSIPPKIWLEYRLILQYEKEKKCDTEFADFAQKYCQEQEVDLMPYYQEEIKQGLTRVASLATAQVAPICAILGGVIGNEVIKVLSGKGEPANNLLLLDGFEGSCRRFLIK